MRLVTTVSTIKFYEPGTSISYGRRYVTDRRTRMGVLAIGYADGLFRAASNKCAFAAGNGFAPQRGYHMYGHVHGGPDGASGGGCGQPWKLGEAPADSISFPRLRAPSPMNCCAPCPSESQECIWIDRFTKISPDFCPG
ncbi:MAG: alanine racemase C-terminal domain-containing protein [Oscillospiraceae bacterium]